MTQLQLLNLPEIDPRIQQEAARKLARLVEKNKRSFSTIDYAKRHRASKLGWQRRRAAHG